jgi:hypothetical protein
MQRSQKSLFADDIIVCLRIPTEATKGVTRIDEFSKLAECKG